MRVQSMVRHSVARRLLGARRNGCLKWMKMDVNVAARLACLSESVIPRSILLLSVRIPRVREGLGVVRAC